METPLLQQPRVILEVKNLKKSFHTKVVHKNISFQLYDNEILGLFGGSGTGKSLILRSLIGLEKPEQGEIIFKNQNIMTLQERDLFKIRTQISYVFQNGALFDSLTVEENLAYPLIEHTLFSADKIKKKVNAMLEMVDMQGSNHLYPNQLSGGMQKRAGLARAIILEPQIILFDEPTAGLDPTNTQRLLCNMKHLKKRGKTGIFVTHDIPSALEIADRIAILNEGVIEVIDSVETIKKSDHPLVQTFLLGRHLL